MQIADESDDDEDVHPPSCSGHRLQFQVYGYFRLAESREMMMYTHQSKREVNGNDTAAVSSRIINL